MDHEPYWEEKDKLTRDIDLIKEHIIKKDLKRLLLTI